MTYTKIKDYVVPRLQAEAKAKERIRSTVLSSFFTCYLGSFNFRGLNVKNITRWYNQGYLNDTQIYTLYKKGVITSYQGKTITGNDWEYELPETEDYEIPGAEGGYSE